MREVLDEWKPIVDDAIEDIVPREMSETYLREYFGPARYQYDLEAIQRTISDPIWDLLDRGGKRWRPVVFLLLVEGFGEDPTDYLEYATIPELLHTGTIIVDDIEDDAKMRRGEPALHHVYGTDIALNAGNALYFVPLKIITHDPGNLDDATRLRAHDMLMYELNRTHLGQGVDICWHDDPTREVTEAEYLEMSACKTGCLARIVARLAAIVTGQDRETEQAVARYAERMSIAFQIGDDILDVENSLDRAGEFGKAFGNDVREGKKTLMVINALDTADPEDATRLLEILDARDNTDEEIREAIDLIVETDSLEYARKRALDLAAEARDHLAEVDLEPEPAEQLAEFTRFVIERDA
ncbi:MAG: polyprenyl synthetase family protein [Halobacteriales archaeon]